MELISLNKNIFSAAVKNKSISKTAFYNSLIKLSKVFFSQKSII